MAYCEVTDLLLGPIPLPAYVDAQKYVTDAADEIDSRIGHVYTTPISMDSAGPVTRPTRLFMKRVNSHLATGRLLLAVASPEENKNLHAYGQSLVKESLAALAEVVSGTIVLEGALQPDSDSEPITSVLHYNQDSESAVEAFYDRIANPKFVFTAADRLMT